MQGPRRDFCDKQAIPQRNLGTIGKARFRSSDRLINDGMHLSPVQKSYWRDRGPGWCMATQQTGGAGLAAGNVTGVPITQIFRDLQPNELDKQL